MQHFGLYEGIILTLDQEETIIETDFEITVIPVSKWLLETGRNLKMNVCKVAAEVFKEPGVTPGNW